MMITIKPLLNSESNAQTARTLERLNNLYSTSIGEVPLNRGFGLDESIVDLSMNFAKARYVAEITDKTKKYIPDVLINSIKFKTDNENGIIAVEVVLEFE